MKVLKTFRPNFDIPLRTSNIDTKLLNDIYQQKPTIDPNNQTVDNWWTNMDFSKMLNQQLANENEEKVKVSSINYPDKIDPKLVQKHEDLMTNFQQQLSVGFLTELDILKKTTENKLELNIIPFLEIFDPKEYVDLMLKVKFYNNKSIQILFFLGTNSAFLRFRSLFVTSQYTLCNVRQTFVPKISLFNST